MWMVDPALLCRKHLLGEHVEVHMAVGSLLRGRRLDGYLRDGLLDLGALRARHARLAAEMVRRGYRHRSPLPPFPRATGGRVDPRRALAELRRRCPDCRARTTAD